MFMRAEPARARFDAAATAVLSDRLPWTRGASGLGGDDRLDVVAGHELYVFDGKEIGRVAYSHYQRGSGPVDRHQLVFEYRYLIYL